MQLAWLQKLPIVSALLATAILAVPFLLGGDFRPSQSHFEQARTEAREFFVRRPGLNIDHVGELILGADWLEAAREQASTGDSSKVDLPARMLARSQAKLDALIEVAYAARMNSEPPWRFGVLDANTPPANYLTHAFVHEVVAGVVLGIAILLLVGIPLERNWGSILFALFSVASLAASAGFYRLLDSTSGIPWSGSAGLAGALLGAYFIRGLGGHFMVPGWLLLPAWLGAEALVVRGLWVDNVGAMPWTTVFASIGFGALVAAAFRLVGIESKLEDLRANLAEKGPNPVLVRAARLRSDGDPYQAFDLIGAAWRDARDDEEISELFFELAVEVGQPEAAADAVVPKIRHALRGGDSARALEYWLPMASAGVDIRLEGTAAVRLGEALLDAGHPEQALHALRGALAEGVSPAHAIRIVNIARDLDEGLARDAAAAALADPSLDAKRRAELEAIAGTSAPLFSDTAAEPSIASSARAPATAGATPVGLSATVDASRPDSDAANETTLPDMLGGAEHEVADTTTFPSTEASASLADEEGDPQATRIIGSSPDSDTAQAAETQLMQQNLDPHALSADGLSAEVGGEGVEESGDVLSHWGDRDVFASPGDDLSLDLSGGLEADLAQGSDLLGAEGLDRMGEALAENEATATFESPANETDDDLTPLMGADELTTAFTPQAQSDELTMLATDSSEIGGETPVVDPHATVVSSLPPHRPTGAATPPDATVASLDGLGADAVERSGNRAEDFAIGPEPASEPALPLRPLKALDAVPVEANADAIEIDVDGRGKSKLPLDRIEAIFVAAISGLASRPVLVVDFALNWAGDQTEPLKVIRIRSDRFDPRQFEPGETDPLEALTAWVRRLQIRSEATCLPSRAILEGRFSSYESIEHYEGDLLAAMRTN